LRCWHVQNGAGLKLNIFLLRSKHLLEINGNFVLLALIVFPNDDGMVSFAGGA